MRECLLIMQIDKVISLANKNSRIQFLALERSLRATGCSIPLSVIPYDDDLFELPKGSSWWSVPEILEWLVEEKAHPMMRKYQCLTASNYQYVDTDVCFVRNPVEALARYNGFVVCCTDWNKPQYTYTTQSQALLSRKTSTFHKTLFNAGQFACDEALYTPKVLRAQAEQPEFVETCVKCLLHDQPGMNLLVNTADVEVTNLTLPPHCMESSWAGDYPGEYEPLWQDPERKPYLIHWAGPTLEWPLPINQLFYEFLTRDEKAEWEEHLRQKVRKRNREYERSLSLPRRVARKVLRRNLA